MTTFVVALGTKLFAAGKAVVGGAKAIGAAASAGAGGAASGGAAWLSRAQLVTSGLTALSQLRAGAVSKAQAQAEAGAALIDAESQRTDAARAQGDLLDRALGVMAGQRLAFAAGGVDPSSGTAAARVADTAAQAERGVEEEARMGEVRALQRRAQAKMMLASGSAAKAASGTAAALTAAQGVIDYRQRGV
jgi:hypothetical protein